MSIFSGTGNTPDETVDFYDVATKFVEEASQSDQPNRLLKTWAHRFPEYAGDLASIAYARIVEANAGSEQATSEEVSAVVNAAQRIVDLASVPVSPITSIKLAASDAGISLPKLAELLRVDIIIIAKLEQRLLKVATIPAKLVEQLADALDRTAGDVTAFLSGSPRLAATADYRSKLAPKISDADQQTFAEALNTSRVISTENREFWLAEILSEENE